jgi:hypothetical protein
MPLPLKIEHRIGIQAPAEVIWSILSDIPGWREWNPIYPKAEGALRIGSVLTLEFAAPGQPPQTIQPQVVDWVPNEQIIWRMTSHLGLLRRLRYLEIEALSPQSCIFSNGEIFEGPMRRFIPRAMRRRFKAAFGHLSEAVRDRAEAVWRDAGGGATLGSP